MGREVVGLRNKKGFTLMEVMTAIAIIAIISGPLLHMFVTSSRVGRWSYDTDKANSIAVGIVEEIKANPLSVSLDESGNATIIHYYTSSWQPAGVDNYVFRAETTVSAVSDGSSINLSYLPELTDDEGNTYAIEINYGEYPSSPYALTVTPQEDTYKVECSNNILTVYGYTSNMCEIPKDHCASDQLPIIPFIVDDEANTSNLVNFNVANSAGVEVALYVYGDYDAENPTSHLVTATPLSGTMSINYMRVQNTALNFDELAVNIKVIRNSNEEVITDYTTKVYLAG